MSQAGVLLDRDGTIIADRGYVGSVDRVEFIDGAIEAIAALNRAGVPVAVVTNQAGVARGYYGIEDVHQVHKHMIEEMARQGAHVDLWLFCPYHPDGIVESFARASADRKPGPGMALAAAAGPRPRPRLLLGGRRQRRRHRPGPGRRCPAAARGAGRRSAPRTSSPSPTSPRPSQHILDEHGPRARPRPRRRVPGPPVRGRRDAFGGAYAARAGPRHASRSTWREIARAAARSDQRRPRPGRGRCSPCGNGGSASIANHLQCDHVKGVRNGTDLRDPGLQPQHEHRAVQRDRQRPRLRHGLRVPAPVAGPAGRRARRHLVVRAVTQHRAGAGVGERATACDTVALTGFTGGAARELRRRLHPRRLGQLRDHRGRAPGMHAPARPVRQAVADDA